MDIRELDDSNIQDPRTNVTSIYKHLKKQLSLQELTITRLKELTEIRSGGSLQEIKQLQTEKEDLDREVLKYKECLDTMADDLVETQRKIEQTETQKFELEVEEDALQRENEGLRTNNENLREKIRRLKKKNLLQYTQSLEDSN